MFLYNLSYFKDSALSENTGIRICSEDESCQCEFASSSIGGGTLLLFLDKHVHLWKKKKKKKKKKTVWVVHKLKKCPNLSVRLWKNTLSDTILFKIFVKNVSIFIFR